MTMRTSARGALLATTVAAFAAHAAAQAPPATPAPAPAAGTQDKQGKLGEWPALKDTDKDKVLALAGQFRKQNPQLHEEAKQQLIALGDGALPLLLQQTSDRADNTNAQLFAVFDAMLGPRHAALMARETKKERVELRRYLTRRLCRFGDPDMAPIFGTLQKDKDELTAFYAQLGLLALKHREALPPVLAYTKGHWNEVGALVAETLAPARSQELGEAVFEAIAKAQATDQMAGLRLLRYVMVKDQTVILRRYLEASDHAVKREAVNTARVLHGEPAVENLSVFQAIEQAKQWLQKL
jgi:hypothetical protein